MKIRIIATFLLVFLCLSALPTSVSAQFDWPEWENTVEGRYSDSTLSNMVYSCTNYYPPFQDATVDEIVHCVANIISEYLQPADSSSTWQDRKIIFDYSTDVTYESFIKDYRQKSTLHVLSNHILNPIHYSSALFDIFVVEGASQNKFTVELRVNTENGDVLRNKLMEIANAAKKYSSDVYGQVEYINRYLMENVSYTEGDLDSKQGQTTYEAIMLGNAVCGGYTSAVQDLCFFLGIPSIILMNNNHAWNCVYVEGQWKMLDVTWNDEAGNEKAYFLVNSIDDSTHTIRIQEEIGRIETSKDFALRLHKKVVQVVFDGKPLIFDVQPQIVNNRTLIPLRAIFEIMGANVEWNSDTQTVTATKDDTVVVLTIGDKSPTINGTRVSIDQPAIVINGRTLAPLRFVAEAFGGSVDWDGVNNTALIS
jgi:hypothetical protein